MLSRKISEVLNRYLTTFPVVVLTGARQVGKTTLLKHELLKTHKYVLLEDLDVRSRAISDPRGFLEQYNPPVIFDEFQYVPELVSYMQGKVDANRSQAGQYVLTGSQNFVMMEQISQSLAGRAGILSLYGLHSGEVSELQNKKTEKEIFEIIFRGFYPELEINPKIKTQDWMSSYLRTYIERDVRNLAQVGDLMQFERFIKLCAIRTGQNLNLSEIGSEVGVKSPTIKRWISILERTYLIHLMQPYYENLTSRIKKSPKLYFLDTGLAAYLMGFKDANSLMNSPQAGALFETLVVSNFIKKKASEGDTPDYCYMDGKNGVGVDLLIRQNNKWDLIEIKKTSTITEATIQQLLKTKKFLGDKSGEMSLVVPYVDEFKFKDVKIKSWFGAL